MFDQLSAALVSAANWFAAWFSGKPVRITNPKVVRGTDLNTNRQI